MCKNIMEIKEGKGKDKKEIKRKNCVEMKRWTSTLTLIVTKSPEGISILYQSSSGHTEGDSDCTVQDPGPWCSAAE